MAAVVITQPGLTDNNKVKSNQAILVQPNQVQLNEVSEIGHWKIDVGEIGNCYACLYSCFCYCCALGDIKEDLDGTCWFVGCCCFNVAALRFLVRTAYNIEGNAHWDCWTGCCCPCCVANQLLQTVKARGHPHIPTVGPEYLLNERTGYKHRSCANVCCDAIYALCCPCCAQGLSLQTAGIPWWFGCLCFNPFGANNVLRYHNRIKPLCRNECLVDCCIPSVCQFFINPTFGFSQPFIGWVYTCGNLVEENNRQGRECGYGLDCCNCISCFCTWLFTCECEQEEGRYLVKSTPVIY